MNIKEFARKRYHQAKYFWKNLRSPSVDRESKKLHLGCGNVHISGYCNVDADYLPAVDLVDNIQALKRFPNNYADQIYACHVLEHISHNEVTPTLKRWFEVLRPGGELRISSPDTDKIVQIYMKHWDHFHTEGNSPWIGLIYGGQSDQYDFHKTGYNFCWLNKLLKDVGFVSIEEYPHEPHFIPGVEDASQANQPFGEYFSLNVKAIKPK